jgi:DNA-binding MarR family transcriptional regulator
VQIAFAWTSGVAACGRRQSERFVYVKLIGEAALADTPLSLLSNRMLAAVLCEPGITVAEISRRIPKTQQAISHVAAQLAELGLIECRLGSPRGVGLHVTETGRRMAEEGIAGGHDTQMRLRELLSDARYETLQQLSVETRAILRGDG